MEPTQTPAPQGDAPTTVAPVQDVVTPAPAEVPAPVQNAPVETKDRTREQFEKLLDSNRRLFETNEYLRRQVDQRKDTNQTFGPIQETGKPAIDPTEFVGTDPETGARFIDELKLQSKLQDIQSRANKAEATVQSYIKTAETREIERQNKETFGSYPELDPSSQSFDLGFHKLVRGALYDSMNFADDNGGRPFTFKEAADFVRTQVPKASQPASQPKPEPAPATPAPQAPEQGQALKEQGSAQATSQPRGGAAIDSDEELKSLQYRTRFLNDDEALAQRILNTDHVRKPAEET